MIRPKIGKKNQLLQLKRHGRRPHNIGHIEELDGLGIFACLRASTQKLRLFAVECGELVGDLMDNYSGAHREAIEIGRRFAFEKAT